MSKLLRFRCREWIRLLRGNRGQALVETALTVPFLMLILVGGVEIARITYVAIEVSNAAKAGAQYAGQSLFTLYDLQGIKNAALAEAPTLTGMTVNETYGMDCSDGSTPSGSPLNCTTSGSINERVIQVKTQFSLDTLLHFPSLPSTITLYGQATQKLLGT